MTCEEMLKITGEEWCKESAKKCYEPEEVFEYKGAKPDDGNELAPVQTFPAKCDYKPCQEYIPECNNTYANSCNGGGIDGNAPQCNWKHPSNISLFDQFYNAGDQYNPSQNGGINTFMCMEGSGTTPPKCVWLKCCDENENPNDHSCIPDSWCKNAEVCTNSQSNVPDSQYGKPVCQGQACNTFPGATGSNYPNCTCTNSSKFFVSDAENDGTCPNYGEIGCAWLPPSEVAEYQTFHNTDGTVKNFATCDAGCGSSKPTCSWKALSDIPEFAQYLDNGEVKSTALCTEGQGNTPPSCRWKTCNELSETEYPEFFNGASLKDGAKCEQDTQSSEPSLSWMDCSEYQGCNNPMQICNGDGTSQPICTWEECQTSTCPSDETCLGGGTVPPTCIQTCASLSCVSGETCIYNNNGEPVCAIDSSANPDTCIGYLTNCFAAILEGENYETNADCIAFNEGEDDPNVIGECKAFKQGASEQGQELLTWMGCDEDPNSDGIFTCYIGNNPSGYPAPIAVGSPWAYKSYFEGCFHAIADNLPTSVSELENLSACQNKPTSGHLGGHWATLRHFISVYKPQETDPPQTSDPDYISEPQTDEWCKNAFKTCITRITDGENFDVTECKNFQGVACDNFRNAHENVGENAVGPFMQNLETPNCLQFMKDCVTHIAEGGDHTTSQACTNFMSYAEGSENEGQCHLFRRALERTPERNEAIWQFLNCEKIDNEPRYTCTIREEGSQANLDGCGFENGSDTLSAFNDIVSTFPQTMSEQNLYGTLDGHPITNIPLDNNLELNEENNTLKLAKNEQEIGCFWIRKSGDTNANHYNMQYFGHHYPHQNPKINYTKEMINNFDPNNSNFIKLTPQLHDHNDPTKGFDLILQIPYDRTN